MKKFVKSLLILLLISAMAVSIVGCSKSETPPVQQPAQEAPSPAEPAKPALDPQQVILEAAKGYFPKVTDSNNIISAENLKDLLDSNPNSVLIIDIRSAEDFEAGHIPGAVHSAWGKVGEIMDRIPKNKPVIVACYSGQTAGQSVALLRMAGFDNVKSLASGMKLGWTEKSKFPTDGKGMEAAAALSVVTSPANEKEQILWNAAKKVFTEIAGGNRAMIQPSELNDALQSNPNSFYVLDIRSADHFAEGHIEHSIHSAWAKVGDKINELPTNRPIVVGCYSGQTAGQTVGVLRMLGLDARSLTYGVRDGWVGTANLPLVK
ncbi:MAG: rhodanese-like domain-containing protein [Dethiobacter sp.]|jgi:rhodanese-related sulfurtransferase|nr:rhodanese-like domain-containing protein [Dethiobacter sp.]